MNSGAAPTSSRLPIIPAITAGLIVVLIGITSSIAAVFTAAKAAGANEAQTGSWIGAICLSQGFLAIVLSWRYKTPVVLAWSTPGAVLLTTGLAGTTLSDTYGAFLFVGVLLFITGVTGVFDRLLEKIPLPLASALLAGVLTQFALNAFVSAKTERAIVISMFVAFIFSRLLIPKFSALIILVVGLIVALIVGALNTKGVKLGLVQPSFVRPTLRVGTLIGIGIPLYIVTMAAQNVPGIAALRSHGYDIPASPIIASTGAAVAVLSGFGLFGINLAAITAAIAMDPSIHAEKEKRYPAAMYSGLFYALIGLIGGSVASVLGVLPKALVFAVAGFSLIPTIASGLTTAVSDVGQRESAIVTFLITVSGMTLGGIGAPFWAVVAGLSMLFLRRVLSPRSVS
jgi:benzoate membrane transport protein